MLRMTPLRIAILYGIAGALWILFSDRAVDLLIRDPLFATVIQTLKGWVYVAATALFLYLLLAYKDRFIDDPNVISKPADTTRSIPWGYLTAALGVAAAIAMAGYFTISNEIAVQRNAREKEILAIADLKVRQIRQWRDERTALAAMIMDMPDIAALLDNPSDQWRRLKIKSLMRSMTAGFDFERIALFDTRGRIIISTSDTPLPAETAFGTTLEKSRRTGGIELSDFYRDDKTGRVRLAIITPVFRSLMTGKALKGFVLFELNPHAFLYPLVRSWPTISATAESVLVMQEGENVVFLNELRHRAGAALTFKLPLTTPNLPAAEAIRGKEGVTEGIDYNGMPVVAALRSIPDSPWYLVAKVDTSEILVPAKEQATLLTLLALALIGSSGLGIGLLWRTQNARFYRAQYEAETKRLVLMQHYEYLSKYANDIILLLDVHGRVLEANDRALSAYGYTLDEIRKLDIRDLRAPETLGSLGEQLERLNQDGGILFETMHRHKNGSIFPVEVSARLFEINGKRHIQSILRDITERKEAERRVIHANRLYAVLSRINEAIVKIADRQPLFEEVCSIIIEFGRFRMAWIGLVSQSYSIVRPVAWAGVEEGYLKNCSIPLDDVPEGRGPVGTSIREARPSVFNDILSVPPIQSWREAATARGYRSVAALPIRCDGRVIGSLTIYSGEAAFFNESEMKLLVDIADDISYALDKMEEASRRREAETRLRDSEHRYRILTENVTDLITSIDPKGTILFASPSCLALTGYRPEEVLGSNAFDFMHPDDQGMVRQALASAMDGTLETATIYRLIRKDKETLWVESTARALPDQKDGQRGEIVAVTRNITERKHAEDLRIAMMTAERASQAKSDFLASISHELRTPLNAIIGFSEVLRDGYFGTLGEKQNEYINDIHESGMHLLSLINDILDISKIEAGKSELNLTEVTIGTLLEHSGVMIKEKTMKHGITVRYEIAPEVRTLLMSADERKLKQIMFNLLTNAAKFTPDGGAITVSARIDDGTLLVCVHDTGIGVLQELQDRIFEPFYQVRSDLLLGKPPGTGLGLSLTRQFVEMHGGRIWVESEGEGKGSSFFFTLPIKRPA